MMIGMDEFLIGQSILPSEHLEPAHLLRLKNLFGLTSQTPESASTSWHLEALGTQNTSPAKQFVARIEACHQSYSVLSEFWKNHLHYKSKNFLMKTMCSSFNKTPTR
jgi:hypothetical protein